MTRNDLILVANWVILLKRLLNDPTNSREEATKLFIDEVMGDCATRNKNFSVAKFLDYIKKHG
ncbi:MAG TPA: hypothetical protein PLP73_01870 [Candidatus Absconditabacterales bacterium]|nr:hypothetical protein [Candidatus Absconditabacterales bacterium]